MFVLVVSPVHCAIVTAAASTAVGPCGPNAGGQGPLFVLGFNL